MKSISDTNVKSTSEINVKSVSDENLKSNFDKNLKSVSDENVKSVSDENVKSISDTNVKSTRDKNVKSISEINVEAISNTNAKSYPDKNAKSTSEINVEAISDTNAKSTSEINVEAISDTNVKSVSDTNAKSTFDVIDYPLKIKENTKLLYHYNRYKIEFRIMDTPDSKIIFATKKRNNDLLLLLDIDEDKVHVIGHTTNFYQFEGPLDFYIDNTESLPFYYNLGDKLINGNITELLDISQFKIDKFPPYTPPIINHYEKDKIKLNIKQIAPIIKTDEKTFRIYFEDAIPELTQINISNNEEFNKIKDFILNIPDPILKISNILSLFVEYKKTNNYVIKNDKLRKYLPLFRYFIMDGPFRKSWIPFGFDPKIDKNNYKYQVIDLRAEGTFFHLFEKETIIREVEKNMDWYVKEKCDIKNGFFKKTLTQLVLYQNYINFETVQEKNDDDCFEIFE